MTSVLIVDDHFALRLGLTVAVNNEPDLKVTAEAGSVADAISAYAKAKPDVVLMDYSLPDGTGVEALKAIKEQDPDARVLMLTIFDGEEDIYRAYEAGASGYLDKSTAAAIVIGAIRRVKDGGRCYPKDALAKVEARMQREPLSPREMETLQLIVEGLINKEIGARLGITEGTAKLHVAKILAKLGAADRTRAAILAVERGIVRLR
jgi:DNA-binding NarL/FixJ family response regulator